MYWQKFLFLWANIYSTLPPPPYSQAQRANACGHILANIIPSVLGTANQSLGKLSFCHFMNYILLYLCIDAFLSSYSYSEEMTEEVPA